ncbi:MAG: cyanophycinase [Longimicrobiales bacterium]|nr:cyanophycinase [Longimicrobiales bacterium]
MRKARARLGSRLGVVAALALLAATGACGEEALDVVPTGGRLVIVGGGLDAETAPVWEAVVEGRDGDGPLCVLPTASGVPERSMASARDALNRYGGEGTAVGVMITEGDTAMAADPEVVARLEACAGYWFVGGQQSRVTATLAPGGEATPALEAIRRRHQDGAVVAGTSAGAAIMSPWMIAGGSSEEALEVGFREEPEGDGVVLTDGLGFFPTGVVDQHFLARGRIGRLLVTVLERPEIAVGFGIDENTALVVDGGEARVAGESGVVVVDGRGDDPERAVLSLAGPGDRIDLRTLEVTFDPAKVPLPVEDASFAEVDILERWAFLNALLTFSTRMDVGMVADFNGRLLTLEKGDGFRAVMDAPGGAEGTDTERTGPQGTPAGFGAGPFKAELAPR